MLPSASRPVLFHRVDDGAVLFDAATEVYFSLNSVGARIWELLPEASGSFDLLCRTVLREYPDADLDTVRGDVEELLEELSRLGLLSVAAEAAGHAQKPRGRGACE